MMVKEAPRFATILCLLKVRFTPCWLVASRRTAGWEARWTCQQEEQAASGWKIRTLAMPIGERESAMAWVWGCDLVEADQTKSGSRRCTVTAAPERAGGCRQARV